MINVAIVGAGPAGSNCAYELTRLGIYPTIFDHSHPREKPCGGMVSSAVYDLFPIFRNCRVEHSERNLMRVISPNGRTTTVQYKNSKLLGFSRLKLDQYLLKKAVSEGTNLIKERVVGLERKYGWWKIKTQERTYAAKTIVGADGINSMVRRNTIGPLPKKDKGLCYGYFIKGLEKEDTKIKFLPKSKGYLWIVSRFENTSVGGGTAEAACFNELKKETIAFVNELGPQAEIISKWAAQIPNVKNVKTFRDPVAGSNWILIGDAAAHVSPISGSGIIYALLDGEKAADAIAEGQPKMFNRLWFETYGQSLFADTKLRNWIYKRPLLELYCMYMKVHNMIPFS